MECPDQSTCRFCHEPITWDEITYVHDSTGFADCGLTITAGEVGSTMAVRINPTILQAPQHVGHRAEPIEWGAVDAL